jgi:hypothetical protein
MPRPSFTIEMVGSRTAGIPVTVAKPVDCFKSIDNGSVCTGASAALAVADSIRQRVTVHNVQFGLLSELSLGPIITPLANDLAKDSHFLSILP